jgi:hypothetical protein
MIDLDNYPKKSDGLPIRYWHSRESMLRILLHWCKLVSNSQMGSGSLF